MCLSLQEFSKTKESTLRVIGNADTVFLFCGAYVVFCTICADSSEARLEIQIGFTSDVDPFY